jgi:hypothetical protein
VTDMTEVLSRSRAGLDPTIRDALKQGRTVRSRNRDGEYAIVLTDNPIFKKLVKHGTGIADTQADWTIVVPEERVFDLGPDYLVSKVLEVSAR